MNSTEDQKSNGGGDLYNSRVLFEVALFSNIFLNGPNAAGCCNGKEAVIWSLANAVGAGQNSGLREDTGADRGRIGNLVDFRLSTNGSAANKLGNHSNRHH